MSPSQETPSIDTQPSPGTQAEACTLQEALTADVSTTQAPTADKPTIPSSQPCTTKPLVPSPEAPPMFKTYQLKTSLSNIVAGKALTTNFKKTKHSTRSLKPSQSSGLNTKKHQLISSWLASELVEDASVEPH